MNEAGCDYKQMLMPIDEALQLLLNSADVITETELVQLNEANTRVLAEDIVSKIKVPPADNSSMDGYAVRSEEFLGVDEKRLPVSQRIPAGTVGVELQPGTVARIFTGATIPAGSDAVVMQEVCVAEGERVTIRGPFSAGENIRCAGEDINIGDTILETGLKLRPQDIGLLASIGMSQVKVYRRLRVATFFTGDELREPGADLELGQIFNSNRYTLQGLLENLNCDFINLGIVEDTLEATKAAMLKAAESADLVMTSGGVSVGEEDYIRIALEELGQLDLWRINIKPGKPLAFGQVSNTPFLGMPGNPVSVFATFCIFARPFILKKQGVREIEANSFMVPAAFTWERAGTRNEYLRAKIKDGKIEIFSHQGSGVLISTSWANGLVFIPENTTVKVNDLVEFTPFSEISV